MHRHEEQVIAKDVELTCPPLHTRIIEAHAQLRQLRPEVSVEEETLRGCWRCRVTKLQHAHVHVHVETTCMHMYVEGT